MSGTAEETPEETSTEGDLTTAPHPGIGHNTYPVFFRSVLLSVSTTYEQFQEFLKVFRQYLKKEITKQQAIKKATYISETYGRIISEEEEKEIEEYDKRTAKEYEENA